MYTHLCRYVYLYIYKYIYTCIHAHTCRYTVIFEHRYMYICTHTCIYIYIYICKFFTYVLQYSHMHVGKLAFSSSVRKQTGAMLKQVCLCVRDLRYVYIYLYIY